MKHILPYLVVVIATLLIVWVLKPFSPKVDVAHYESLIDELEQKVDSLHAKNDILVLEADSLELQLIESDKKIKQLNSRIYVIKRETQKQLDAVDLFGDDELERFFANRYKDSIN